jgi:hypothetical protein
MEKANPYGDDYDTRVLAQKGGLLLLGMGFTASIMPQA